MAPESPSLLVQAMVFEVLVVDDEASLLEELADFLSFHRIKVDRAADGPAALAELDKRKAITVVLTDIRMPVMDGLSLATRILHDRGDADAVEVVLMTGHGTIDNAAEAVRAGAFDFLRKPMDLEQLLAVLRRAHARAVGRRDAFSVRIAEMAKLKAAYADLQDRFARADSSLNLTAETPPVLAHVLAQELRAPLAPLLSFLDMMSDQESVPPGLLNAYLREAQKAGNRLSEAAEDVIELLAPPSAESMDWRGVPPATIVGSLDVLSQPVARHAQVRLVRGSVAEGQIETCESRLLSELVRLVAKAVQASKPGGRVELSAEAAPGDAVAFIVRDHGPGMSDDDIKLACQPFRQVDGARAKRIEGLGLAYALAERMAARLGGTFRLESKLGSGTTASIVLPRVRKSGRTK